MENLSTARKVRPVESRRPTAKSPFTWMVSPGALWAIKSRQAASEPCVFARVANLMSENRGDPQDRFRVLAFSQWLACELRRRSAKAVSATSSLV